MRFGSIVEPAEPMRGLSVPAEVVAALGAGKRPPVTITINGHSWKSKIARSCREVSHRSEQRQPNRRRPRHR